MAESEPDWAKVSRKLDLLARLLALSVTDGKRQTDQITLLNRAGFSPKDIADLLGTSANAVSVELSRLRKAGAIRTVARRR